MAGKFNKVVWLWMQAAQRRAGLAVTNGGVHALRHTFCSHLAMQGPAAKAIQELAGHTTLTPTRASHPGNPSRTAGGDG